MQETNRLKHTVKQLIYAVQAADEDKPTPAQLETIIGRGCEVFEDAVCLIKAIWQRAA
jgi:hypothetical protein